MDQKERFIEKALWKDRYIDAFVSAGLTVEDGKTAYDAALSDHDFDEDPEDAARGELGYWADDR